MEELAQKDCTVGSEDMAPLSDSERDALLARLPNSWICPEGQKLVRRVAFPDFMSGLAFVQEVAQIAEAQCHHPDLELRWGEVVVVIWTHAISGLTESDFILAAKLETCLRAQS